MKEDIDDQAARAPEPPPRVSPSRVPLAPSPPVHSATEEGFGPGTLVEI